MNTFSTPSEKFSLIDDGTLDTVIECNQCGEWIRYDSWEFVLKGEEEVGRITSQLYDRFKEARDDAFDWHECEGDEANVK
jgi:hypothetical protein